MFRPEGHSHPREFGLFIYVCICIHGIYTHVSHHSSYVPLHASMSATIMDGHMSRIFGLAYHPHDPRLLISAGWDDTVQVSLELVGVCIIETPHHVRSTRTTEGFTMYTHATYVLAMKKSFSFCLGNMHMFMYVYICNIHVLCFSSSVLGHTTASLNPVSCMVILCTVQPSSHHLLSIQAPYVSPISIMYFSHFHIFYQNSKGSRPPLYWY